MSLPYHPSPKRLITAGIEWLQNSSHALIKPLTLLSKGLEERCKNQAAFGSKKDINPTSSNKTAFVHFRRKVQKRTKRISAVAPSCALVVLTSYISKMTLIKKNKVKIKVFGKFLYFQNKKITSKQENQIINSDNHNQGGVDIWMTLERGIDSIWGVKMRETGCPFGGNSSGKGKQAGQYSAWRTWEIFRCDWSKGGRRHGGEDCGLCIQALLV